MMTDKDLDEIEARIRDIAEDSNAGVYTGDAPEQSLEVFAELRTLRAAIKRIGRDPYDCVTIAEVTKKLGIEIE